VDESGMFSSKTLTVLPASFEDNTIPMTIGTHEYRTKTYNGLTWMVENSMEGLPSNTYYDDCVACTNYYYYYGAATHAQTPACPAPWRLPSLEEAQGLSVFLFSGDVSSDDVYYWRNAGLMKGYCEEGGVWQHWAVWHHLWMDGGRRFSISRTAHSEETGLVWARRNSVRCVAIID
jgi:hypothetical protein